jgi:hypothetical protein
MGYIQILSDQIGRISEKEALIQLVEKTPRYFIMLFSTVLLVGISSVFPITGSHTWQLFMVGVLVASMYYVTCRLMKMSPFVVATVVIFANIPKIRTKIKEGNMDMTDVVRFAEIDDKVAKYIQSILHHETIYHCIVYMVVFSLLYVLTSPDILIPLIWGTAVPIATLVQYVANWKFQKTRVEHVSIDDEIDIQCSIREYTQNIQQTKNEE